MQYSGSNIVKYSFGDAHNAGKSINGEDSSGRRLSDSDPTTYNIKGRPPGMGK
jgi:hypothetical protein